jgi:Na+/melibiose symporter-like transporter
MILGWTMMLLPLNALAGELCQNYSERTRINTWRESCGLLCGLIPLGLIAGLGFTGDGEQGEALRVIAIIVAITLPLFTACLMWFVKEPVTVISPKSFSISESFQILKQNSYFKILIRSYFLNAVANGLPASLILIYVSDVLNAPDKVGQFLFIYFLAGIISTPFWNHLGTKFSKHKIWCVAMGFACFVFAAIPFLNEGDVTAYLVICILTGIVFGADLIYPPSMQADVIDSDAAISGQSRAGLFFALWGIATKLSLALATGFGFLLLDYFQKSDFIIIILYAIIPIIFKIISMAGMWNFGLTKEILHEIQNQTKGV